MKQVQNKHKHKRKHDHQNPNKNNKQRKFGKKQYYRNKRVHADQHLSDEIRQILRRYRYLTNQMRSYVIHCSEEQLLWSINLSSWNIKQIIGFIGIKDAFILELVNNVISADTVEFKRPDTESDMEQEEFNNRSLEYLMGIYNSQRKKIANAFYQSKSENWDKEFSVDSEIMNLKSYLTLQLDNDEKLLDMIFINLQRNDPWFKEEKAKVEDIKDKELNEKTQEAVSNERSLEHEKEKESEAEKEKEFGKEKKSEEKEKENREEESSKEKEFEKEKREEKKEEIASEETKENSSELDVDLSVSERNEKKELEDTDSTISNKENELNHENDSKEEKVINSDTTKDED